MVFKKMKGWLSVMSRSKMIDYNGTSAIKKYVYNNYYIIKKLYKKY